MDDEDGRCLLDVICDPQALNDFLHGSETHLDTDDLLDGSADPASAFFSGAGIHVPQVQPSSQLSVSEPPGLPSGTVDLDFLEDDDILGGSPGGGRVIGSNGVGGNHEPCDILQQSLAEANITEQSLQEAEAELDLDSFGLPGLTQVVQTLPDPSLSVPGAGGVPVGVDLGGQIFSSPVPSTTATPPNATADMIGSVLAHQGLQLQPQVMNKAMSVQPFMQQVGLGNMTLQSISNLQALPNGSQSGHLGIGQIQVVGQPTVMAINQSGQQILAKTMSGYQLHQPGPDTGSTGAQPGLSGSVLSSSGGLLIQGGKATLGSPALNGAGVGVSSSGASTITSSGGLVGFGSTSLGAGLGAQHQTQTQGQIMQNVIIQRTPTPIQPKPPQGGVVQPKLYKQSHMQQQPPQQFPAPNSLQNDASKGVGVQQGPVPVSTTQSVAFLTGKPGSNVVLSTQAGGPQGAAFPQTLFKPQATHTAGKPLSVHLLNQSGSIMIPSQTVLQGQNHQFLLPQLQAGGQILTQHSGGHIITSQGPGGQIIANQILTTNQNLNLGQVLTPQGHPGTAHILSGHIQLQPGQMGHPTLFQMPVSLAQNQAHPGVGHSQAVIQGMPIHNSLAMLGQLDSLGPAVSLQPPPPPQAGVIPCGGAAMAPCQPTESVTVLSGTMDQAAHPTPTPPSILTVQTTPSVSVSVSVPSSSPSISSSSSSILPPSSSSSGGLAPPLAQHSPGKLFLTPQGSGMILSQDSLQMFLQQDQKGQSESDPRPSGCVPASVIVSSGTGPAPSATAGPALSPTHSHGLTHNATVVQQIPSAGHQQQLKIQSTSPSPGLAAHPTSDSPQPAQPSPLILGQQMHSPHPPASQAQAPAPARSCTPSSLPPLFIIHNQIGGSPQPAAQAQQQQQQPQIQTQIQTQPCAPSQPASFQPDVAPSCSPRPPSAAPLQLQLTAEQQQTLQLVGAQLQTLSGIALPTAQQKQLQEKLHQVQQNIILQAKQQTTPQPPASNQLSSPQDPPAAQVVTSSAPAQLASLLQQTSVLVKTPSTVSREVKVFSGAPGTAGPTAPSSLMQSVQVNQGVISSVGGLQIQVLASGISQLGTPQSAAAIQAQTAALNRPFSMEPSKEARMLEQLRKQQGSVLRPDYSSPFHSFQDSAHRLLPYHLYQGTVSTPQDFCRVDEEFQSVSCQLLKRTQAMLDKYRLLLFEESKRFGPSAEMVMIDRMFIQEEKVALNQDRVLAKERPEEFVVHSHSLESAAAGAQRPLPAEPGTTKARNSAVGGAVVGPSPASVTPRFMPTKLVIKQGGGRASVSWSSSSAPATGTAARLAVEPAGQSSSVGSTPPDEDALPQRSSKPPMKTYEARQRIGLKLKIKQEAGLTKVVHNTALDPVHTPSHPQPSPAAPPPPLPAQPQQHPGLTVTTVTTVIRTPPPAAACSGTSSSAVTVTVATAPAGLAPSTTASSLSPPFPLSFSSSSSSSFSSVQVNGTLEHHDTKRNPASVSTAPPTTCRLPLRKTYRENVSPQGRPGEPGGSGSTNANLPPLPQSRDPSPPPTPERTVIASVKLEKRDGKGRGHPHAGPRAEHGAGPGGGASHTQEGSSSPPGLMKELAEVEEVFNRGIKNTHRRHRRHRPQEGEGDGARSGRGSGKSRRRGDGSSRKDRQPPSPPASPRPLDPSLPAKRRKSDSPDMDNASFSSGSPPPDDSLNEHLQSAIDSILNLQQGVPSRGGAGRSQGAHPSQPPPPQRPAVPSTSSNRPPSSSSVSQRLQLGGASGRGHNGNFVSRTYSR